MRRIPIVQGEHCVVAEPNVVITTLLGSCIAVCLHDGVAKVGGMNHFLLSEPSGGAPMRDEDMLRYGVHAMELLINAMMKLGAIRLRMRAQIYGGGNIVAGLGNIGESNAAFAQRFLTTEGISVGHSDVGGRHARKVEFLPYEGKARCNAVTDSVPVGRVAPPVLAGGELELF